MYVWVNFNSQFSNDCLSSFVCENGCVWQISVAGDYDFMQFSYLKSMWYFDCAVAMLKYFVMYRLVTFIVTVCSFRAFLFA